MITEVLGIQKPLVLAPMGSVSGGALAAAVSRAGGLGLIGAGYGDAKWMRREFEQAKGAHIGIGFITWSLAKQPRLLDFALERKPSAVMLSFGDPRPFAEKIRASGAKLICQVRSLAIARQALEARPDVLVAQGTEAGGHGGMRALFTLLPAVKDMAGDVPVLAAGGIADRRGYDAAMALSADGVLVGTRFSASDEALTAPRAKQRIVETSGDATLRTTVFDVVRGYDAGWAGVTGRALRNKFTEAWHGREAELTARREAEAKNYWQAAERQDFDTALIFAGEGVDLIDAVLPAAEIVRRIVH
ncbi:MAG TPA: nitronate monooxygenase [Burkholderiales bacterium]|nr:nitronate monooxygenase [Burkholderiales bacterium]